MRELILLRHAHTESPVAGQADADRPLSAEGQAAAEAVGRWLLEQGKVPDCVLCSPARRAQETLQAVLGVVGYVDQRLEPAIYEARAQLTIGTWRFAVRFVNDFYNPDDQ